MIELASLCALGFTLYAMKAVPYFFGRLPQNRFVLALFDLVPVGLLTALLLSPVVVGAVEQPMLEALLVVLAVIAALGLSALTNQAAIGILAGLAVLAVAELV
ncbi:MAG: AzlD domain-containing protein [Reyranellaceae bacterium]